MKKILFMLLSFICVPIFVLAGPTKPPCDVQGDLSTMVEAVSTAIYSGSLCLKKLNTFHTQPEFEEAVLYCERYRVDYKEAVKYLGALDYDKQSSCYDYAMEWKQDHVTEADVTVSLIDSFEAQAQQIFESLGSY